MVQLVFFSPKNLLEEKIEYKMTEKVKPGVIKMKKKAVLADRKNANNIADLISYMEVI